MEKLLRQFAPFVALVVAAGLVVMANPAENASSSSAPPPPAVAATASAARAAVTPAPVPTNAAAPGAGVSPFGGGSSVAGSAASASVPSFAGAGSSGFSGGSSTGSSFAPAASSSTDTPFPGITIPAAATPAGDVPASGDSFATPSVPSGPAEVPMGTPSSDPGVSDFFLFEQVKAAAVCSSGGDAAKPLSLAGAYAQNVIASEPAFPDRASGITFNKTDLVDPDRYLYRTHGLIANSSVSVTDTTDNSSRILAQRPDWERLEGVVWTQNRTLIAGENVRVQQNPAPSTEYTAAGTPKAGIAYEINPVTGTSRPLPILGSRSHKGMAFDHLGNLYGVSATVPGYAYRFVPMLTGTTPDYTRGTLSALWIGPNGESTWLQLNANTSASGAGVFTNNLAVTDTDEAARLAGATALLSPEDAEMLIVTSSTGVRRSQLFIAETGANRVLTAVLRTVTATTMDNTAYVSTYAAPGVNAPKDFAAPSDLALDTTYNLYIAERNGGGLDTSKTSGDDVWVAPANSQSAIQSTSLGRIASVTDCDATATGLMFDLTGSKLFLNLKGRGGDGRDMTILITTAGGS